MAVRITLVTVLAIAGVLALLYVIPTATGYQIDCGTLERTICEEAWQEEVRPVFAASEGPLAYVPITGVTVVQATNENPACGGTWTVHRYGLLDNTLTLECR